MADGFEESLTRHGRGFTFGTGVQELIFPPDHEAFVADQSTYNKWAVLLKQCEYVSVRGPRSQMALAEMGITSEVIGDPACALVRPAGFWQPRSGHLGLNTGNGGGSIWGNRDKFSEAMGSFVADAIRQGWKVEFFALMDDDIKTTQRVARIAGIADPVIRCEYVNPERFMSQVSKMEAFIGLKLHSVILAMCAMFLRSCWSIVPRGSTSWRRLDLSSSMFVRATSNLPRCDRSFPSWSAEVSNGPRQSEHGCTISREFKRPGQES